MIMAGPSKLKRPRDPAGVVGFANPTTQSHGQVDQEQSTNAHGHAEPASKKARVDAGRTLFVRGLPPTATDDSLTDLFSQHFPVKHAVIVKDPTTKVSRGYAFVTLTDPEDCSLAQKKLHGHRVDGRPLNIELADRRERKPTTSDLSHISKKEQRQAALAEARKPASKLIIRNLPWSIKTSDQLAALFRSYGKVKFADVPQSKGKLSGFGFVTLRGHTNSQRALDEVNGKVVDGRTLAVDWAVSKEEWSEQQTVQGKNHANLSNDSGDKEDIGKAATNKIEGHQQKDKNEDKEDEEDEEDEDLRNFMKNHMENLEDEESDADDEEGAREGDEDSRSEKNDTISPKPLMTDNSSTIFIRNLPFSTTDEQLKSHFTQFGPIRYARVVMDRATDRPAGTGFCCFVSVDDAKACLKGAPRALQPSATGKRSILQDEMADSQGLYTLEGRVLHVSQAVSKDEATRLTAEGVAARDGKDRDKRRLYLLSEGTISSGSPLYSLLTPSEVQMREQSAVQRKKQIQSNPSLHLSLTRLAVRNIPRDLGSKELKALAREAVVGFATDVKEGRRQPLSKEEVTRGGDEDKIAEHNRKEKGKGVVKQAKLVFENREGSKVAENDGAGRSRGYGFIEYSSHRWALMGLRWLNGHAMTNAAGKPQRLIVEFAIENAQVVSRRNERQGRPVRGLDQVVRDGRSFGRDRGVYRETREHHKFAAARVARKGTDPGSDKPTNDTSFQETKTAVRNALEQKIIGRKRTMKKKKAVARRSG
ncbi:hypothetical protein BX600DRAFT_459644 [Xylariales sp. PMI_506]|nr:hypothetical protein BX600DRAFT_459644 [Xylariales sp. PMI_506]